MIEMIAIVSVGVLVLLMRLGRNYIRQKQPAEHIVPLLLLVYGEILYLITTASSHIVQNPTAQESIFLIGVAVVGLGVSLLAVLILCIVRLPLVAVVLSEWGASLVLFGAETRPLSSSSSHLWTAIFLLTQICGYIIGVLSCLWIFASVRRELRQVRK